MKGVIFNVVEDAVVESHGEAAWDAILDAAGLRGSWTAIGDYPDAELLAVVRAGSGVLDVDPDELTRDLGHAALFGLARRYPAFVEPHTDPRSFLLTLNDVIHPEVRKLHPAARPPRFEFELTAEQTLLVDYHSHRPLCRLADGMIRGAAAWFGETAEVVHETCARGSDTHCRLRCTFAAARAAGTAAG